MQETVRHGSITGSQAGTPVGTRRLLAAGAAAGPLYIGLVLLQAVTRPGFDLRYHAASLLSNGDLGWVQIGNFVVSGLLVVGLAVGVRRVLAGGLGGVWGPRLLGVYGGSLIAAGVFVADPAFGFPAGTPAGPPEQVTLSGVLHFAAGGVGFLALIAACLVFARRFASAGERGWAVYSAATGVLFAAAFVGIASGSGDPAVNVAFGVAVAIGWAWVTALCVKLWTAGPA